MAKRQITTSPRKGSSNLGTAKPLGTPQRIARKAADFRKEIHQRALPFIKR